MRKIASIIMGIAGIILLLGASHKINMENFDPSMAALGLSAISISISLFWRVWVQPNGNNGKSA